MTHYYGDDTDLGARQEADELQAQADRGGRRDIGVLRYSYARGGMACTLHPDAAAMRVRDGRGAYIEDRDGSNLYQCEDCGASAWSDT